MFSPGPASARTLAEYGAEVIKIDPPEPYFGPRISSWFPLEVSPWQAQRDFEFERRGWQGSFYEVG